MNAPLHVRFCGEQHDVQPGTTFSFGRDADLIVDDANAFLHRRTGTFVHDGGFWWVVNTGARTALTISGADGSLQSWIGPAARLPLVLPAVSVLFTAGETTYEIEVRTEGEGFASYGPLVDLGDGTLTQGAVTLTSSQFLLILALAEPALRRPGQGIVHLPTNHRAAQRLGWSITTFNRKLDNVCEKFSRAGVKGLHGEQGRLATTRRARLVEYAVAARIVERHHLDELLDDSNRKAPA